MSNVYVKWNDSSFVWGGSEDFIWSEAYRIISDVVDALGGDWYGHKKWEHIKKKLPEDLADKFLDVVIKVNGLSKTYKKQINNKPKITIDHIQKTFSKYESKISVKAKIK